jgi:hypothetical protein
MGIKIPLEELYTAFSSYATRCGAPTVAVPEEAHLFVHEGGMRAAKYPFDVICTKELFCSMYVSILVQSCGDSGGAGFYRAQLLLLQAFLAIRLISRRIWRLYLCV